VGEDDVIRKAFRMTVHAGSEAEYERRHNPIFADLERTLLEHGVSTYSIFLDPVSRDLFAYVEIESEERWRRIADPASCRRWWRHMRDLMAVNPDDSPVSSDLREVFHLERDHPRPAVRGFVASSSAPAAVRGE
jgi:L-rhamnose mutarotase